MMITIDGQTLKARFIETLRSVNRDNTENLIKKLEDLGFFTAPGTATKKYHSYYESGLVDHSIRVCNAGLRLKARNGNKFGDVSTDSIKVATLLHDVCKSDQYDYNGGDIKKLFDSVPHGTKSVDIIEGCGFPLTDEEKLAILWHMGRHTKDQQTEKPEEEFKKISSAHPLVELTSQADGIASKERRPWYPEIWLDDFNKYSDNHYDEGLHSSRIYVYEDTKNRISGLGYSLNDGTNVTLPDDSSLIANSILYKNEIPKREYSSVAGTEVMVWDEDAIIAGKRLLDAGCRPAVLNLASPSNPGGGVRKGCGAQEENLFRRTNLFRSMYQFANYAHLYNLDRAKDQYPLDENWGGVYSPRATVIRGTEKEGYPLLEHPFQLDFIAVAAVDINQRHNHRHKNTGSTLLNESEVKQTLNKMRTIFRIALENGNDSLVLGAFGCGAFKNSPEQIASLFHQVMNEDEFNCKFKKIVFAILENHHSYEAHNPNGNLIPFQKEFSAEYMTSQLS